LGGTGAGGVVLGGVGRAIGSETIRREGPSKTMAK
jgi:hypothetical protein